LLAFGNAAYVKMKKSSLLALFVIALFVLTTNAAIQNGGFESGNFSGWSPLSDYDEGNSTSSKIILYDGTLVGSMVIIIYYRVKFFR